jgi:hypothetical protein
MLSAVNTMLSWCYQLITWCYQLVIRCCLKTCYQFLQIITFYYLLMLRKTFVLQNIDVVCVPGVEDLDLSRFTNCAVTGWGRRTEGHSIKFFFIYRT